MDSISVEEGVEIAFASLLEDRLSLLAGAGLSMAAPSSLPSAKAIADAAKARYSAIYGSTRPPLADSVDEQAQFFFSNDELATFYFRILVDPHAFAGRSNLGHIAAADLLLIRAIQTAVTTNVDTLIEQAAGWLFGSISAGIDGDAMTMLSPDEPPLLKIHGCHHIDREHMVWAIGQLAVNPVADRVNSGAQWLEARLRDRDLVIIGYWTDWDYLNAVLERTLGTLRPSRIIVVDPGDPAQFEIKAPVLFALGQRAASAFLHVQASGAIFLDTLRMRFSSSFVRQVLHAGIPTFTAATGITPDASLTEPPAIDNESFWLMRRDLEGRRPTEPAKERVPPTDPLLGQTLLRLKAAGGIPDGSYWQLNGQKIRVIRTPGELLHIVQQQFERDTGSAVSADLIIAVGSESLMLPASITRSGTESSITRGSPTRWLTRPEAVAELGI